MAKNRDRNNRDHRDRDNHSNIPTKTIFSAKRMQRRRYCPLSLPGSPEIDYKNIKLLSKFVSERGRILPSRITSVSAKKQRELKVAIKRARILALLPFISEN